MNNYSPYTTVTETFTYPNTPDSGSASVVVYYDFGDTVLAATAPTLVSGTQYSITVSDDLIGAAGLYRVKWSCTFSGTAFYAYTEFKVEEPYMTLDQFIIDFPDYDNPTYTTRFDFVEKNARRIIDTYCGQSFQFIKNKTAKYDGNNRDTLNLGMRLNSFSSVFIDESDFTDKCAIDLKTKYFIKLNANYPYFDSRKDDYLRNIFPNYTTVSVTGDWGWMSVPDNVRQASEILISDLFDDTRREHHTYGITRLEQGNNRLQFDPSIFNSTGNIDVDTLLMDYVYWVMDYVF
jgi:hypothetical protein